MKRVLLYIWITIVVSTGMSAQSDTLVFTLAQVIELAQEQSPDIRYARHSFRSSYWSYCYYKANYRPAVSLNANPSFNHAINAVTQNDGNVKYLEQNLLNNYFALSISQNIALTGGNLYVSSNLSRMDNLNTDTHSYNATLATIGYSQQLFGYNGLKWDKKIEPLRYEQAKRSYVVELEAVAARALSRFFNLAHAQTDMQITQINLANADTLYRYAQGRYEIGTITENDMLQLEIKKLNEESSLLYAQLTLEDRMDDLRSFLGITDAVPIRVVVEDNIPLNEVSVAEALDLALVNNPRMLGYEISKLQSDAHVADAKANAGLRADLNLRFGLAQTGNTMEEAYRNPLNQQVVSIGFSMPILDWGRGKGRVEMAKSSREMTLMSIEQNRYNFEVDVMKTVKQFNLQPNQLVVAAKTDKIAERRGEVARRLYMSEKSSILELNNSIAEKDAAKRAYINTLHSYWSLYYAIRQYTLYDFEKGIQLTEDYDLLLK